MDPIPTTIGALLDEYDGVLLDAYGVLVDARGALPAARPLLAELARRGTPFAVVTNDASRSAETYERRFAGMGMIIPAAQIVTSGSLLPAYFRARGLEGARTAVLGTEDSRAYVRAGGGVPIELEPGMTIDALAVCDDSGTPFQDGLEWTMSAAIRAITEGRRPALVVPNPDLTYPKTAGEYGVTAGAMVLVIERVLARRFPADPPRFDALGKPEPHVFREAARRLGDDKRLVMIGDTLDTDIAGARAAGLDAALLEGGVTHWHHARGASDVAPTHLLATIEP
ncbi:MAG TPA: HAD-IA family hydrolase [Kofleriaceae bacterium]